MTPGWRNVPVVNPAGQDELHMVPRCDIEPHFLAGGQCPCTPVEDDEFPRFWKHNAFDTRESYENGRRFQ